MQIELKVLHLAHKISFNLHFLRHFFGYMYGGKDYSFHTAIPLWKLGKRSNFSKNLTVPIFLGLYLTGGNFHLWNKMPVDSKSRQGGADVNIKDLQKHCMQWFDLIWSIFLSFYLSIAEPSSNKTFGREGEMLQREDAQTIALLKKI